MLDRFFRRMDRLGRRYPRLMLLLTISVAVVVALALLGRSEEVPILYEAF
jgi:hypothetical protein